MIRGNNVALNFPYKDCVLKGAQSKDSDKSDEIFFNEILASDEIDVLFKPKALQNFELVNSACSDFLGSASDASLQRTTSASHSLTSHNPKNSSTILEFTKSKVDNDNTHNLKSALQHKPNLLIKGNNLLALHTLKSRRDIYGQVKLIYIDPPYNTGNDSFNYNDRFNHSAWLVFMKNRLEIAREFLREDGVIFIQCDDNEQAYLKVLCDEIFGRENFVACFVWEKKGGRQNDAKFYSVNHEYILNYARKKENFTPNLLERTQEMLKQYKNPDNDPRGIWTSITLQAKSGNESMRYKIKFDNGVEWEAPAGTYPRFSKENLENLYRENRLWFGESGKNTPRLKKFLCEIKDGVIHNTLLMQNEVGNTQKAKQEIKSIFADSNADLFSTPKPEALLKRIIEISTKEGDLVMDFFAGSGTTCAVAHKMNRRWIGIEQMDYVEGITKERLIKVINGEQGGISKAVGWNPLSPSLAEGELPKNESLLDCHTERSEVSQDSRDFSHSTNAQNDKNVKPLELPKNAFIYCELMPLNALYKEKIAKSSSEGELARIYDELQTKAFIDYRVDIKEMLKDRDFEALPLADKKQILYAILDSNMDYVAYSDMEDSNFCVDKEVQGLNRAFYEGGENG